MTLRELRQKRANLIAQARAIIDDADKAGRPTTQEEDNRYTAFMNEAAMLKTDIDRREQLETLETELGQSASEPNRPDPEGIRSGAQAEEQRGMSDLSDRYRNAIEGIRSDTQIDERTRARFESRMTPQYQVATRAFLRGQNVPQMERRDLQASLDPYGGYLTPPPTFVARLLQAVDNMLFFRQPGWATVFPILNGDSLGIVSLDADPDDGEWTTEIAEILYDAGMAFGRRELKTNPLRKGIKVSRKLLRLRPDVENLTIDRFRYNLP